MGFFSFNCEVCEHPLLSPMAVGNAGPNEWMCAAVALEADGTIHAGEYDGYGRVGDAELENPEVYHRRCWRLAGKPLTFTKESQSAADQGWFFEEKAHSFPEPKTLEEAQSYRD